MTTIQSPSHALGLMTMGAYQRIMDNIPEALLNIDGPKKIYALLVGLDGMMYSFSDKMYHVTINPDSTTKKRNYTEMMVVLSDRKKDLRFGNPAHSEKWLDWFQDYLKLLSSCFNQIGLAPLKMADNVGWDDEPYIPPEHRTDSESDDEEVPNQSLESDTSG